MFVLFETHILLILDYAFYLWNTVYIEVERLLESMQRILIYHIAGMSNLPYDKRLKEFDLYSVKRCLPFVNIMKYCKICIGETTVNSDNILQCLL